MRRVVRESVGFVRRRSGELRPRRRAVGLSRPVGVAFRDEHPCMADGEDMNFAIDRLVHDAVRLADDLAKAVYVFGDGLEANRGDIRAEIGKVAS